MEVDRVGWDAGRAGSGQHRVLPSTLLRCSTPILEITRRHFLQLGRLRSYLESARSTEKSQGTGVESWSCLFPSTRHLSFNQSKCKEFSKKGFRSIQWRKDLQIDKMIWPINSWHPLIPPDWRQFRPIRCCRGIGG